MPAAAHGIAWKRVEALINLAAVFDKLFRLFFQTLLHPCGNLQVAITLDALSGLQERTLRPDAARLFGKPV